MVKVISPIQDILKRGNLAQQWLRFHKKGNTPRQILQSAITDMVQQEQRLFGELYNITAPVPLEHSYVV